MRTMGLLAAALLVAMTGAAKADEARENAMQKFAEVMAIQYLCNDLRPNLLMMALAGSRYGIDVTKGTADYDELLRRSREQIETMKQYGRVTCIVGIANYGPHGAIVKDLLLKK